MGFDESNYPTGNEHAESALSRQADDLNQLGVLVDVAADVFTVLEEAQTRGLLSLGSTLTPQEEYAETVGNERRQAFYEQEITGLQRKITAAKQRMLSLREWQELERQVLTLEDRVREFFRFPDTETQA